MTAVTVDALVGIPIPTRANPSNFSTAGDQLMTALPVFGAQLTAAGVQVSADSATAATAAATATTQAGLATSNGAAQVTLAAAQVTLATTQAGLATTNGAAQVALATTQVGLATTQAVNAATSATTALNAPGTQATSTDSVAIPTTLPSAKSFTIQTGKSIIAGMTLKITASASLTNYMIGDVTAYNSGTGALTVNVTYTNGAGTFTAWNLTLSAPVVGQTSNATVSKSSAYTMLPSDKGVIVNATGTFTLGYTAAATLGSGWYAYVVKNDPGVVTHDPNASETIGGTTTAAQTAGVTFLVVCDGTNFTLIRQMGTGGNLTIGLNEALATVASSASTSDIWSPGNQINWTGTVACTGFPAAPQAGASRKLFCAGAAPFVAGANMLIAGVASGVTMTCAANDIIELYALTTTQFILNRIKYDGTAQVSTSSGAGGATASGTTTLTAASAGAQVITPTAFGQYVILPDATTCTKNAIIFDLFNAGTYDLGIKNSTGTQLGWIKPQLASTVGLGDNSTAAGVWACSNVEKIAVTAQYAYSGTLAGAGAMKSVIAIDANRTFILFGNTSMYGIVYDASTQTWGTLSLIRATVASNGQVATLSGTNQILVCSCDSSSNMQTVTLTISGTTITVNTPVATSLSGALGSIGMLYLIAVGTSFVVSYTLGTPASQIRAISLSGTTPTVGASASPAGGNTYPAKLYATGSVVRCIVNDDTPGTLYANPYTVSGSTLTAGTTASTPMDTYPLARSYMNSNGNIVALYLSASGVYYASIFKLVGTTESVSAVSTGITSYSGISGDLISIASGKTLLSLTSNASTCYHNILTDTSGTASLGTAVQTPAATSAAICLSLNSNIVKTVMAGAMITLDCSGTSPSIVQNLAIANGGSGVSFQQSLISGASGYSQRCASTLVTATGAYAIGSLNYAYSLFANQSSINQTRSLPVNNSYWPGIALNESWSCSSGVNLSIQRVEAAA